ncbi:hypothetical protein [Streptomyces phaeochromogenes]
MSNTQVLGGSTVSPALPDGRPHGPPDGHRTDRRTATARTAGRATARRISPFRGPP